MAKRNQSQNHEPCLQGNLRYDFLIFQRAREYPVNKLTDHVVLGTLRGPWSNVYCHLCLEDASIVEWQGVSLLGRPRLGQEARKPLHRFQQWQ